MQKGAGHYFFWGGGRMLGLSPRLATFGLERIESVTINAYVPASFIVPCRFLMFTACYSCACVRMLPLSMDKNS